MTSGIHAHGTLLKNDGTTVAEVLDISGPGLSADAIDMTSHDSTDGYMEAVQGIKDGGEVSFDINFVPTGTTHKNASGGLLYEYEQGTESTWSVVFPDGSSTTWTFPGFITGFEPKAPVKGKLSASVKIKLSGKPTLA